MTHKHTVGLLWTRDRLVAETSTSTTHDIHKRQTSMPSAAFEPAIPASVKPQTYVRRPRGHQYAWDSDLTERFISRIIWDVCLYVASKTDWQSNRFDVFGHKPVVRMFLGTTADFWDMTPWWSAIYYCLSRGGCCFLLQGIRKEDSQKRLSHYQ
jgi:hypothetical protein